MRACVAYDSVYGNTEKIARAIGDAVGGEVKVARAAELLQELVNFDLIVVGCPTHGGRPTGAIREMVKRIPENGLRGKRVAAFDTRLGARWVRIFGFAAPKIAGMLERKGGALAVEPEGFFVERNKGPLRAGELERAAGWARKIAEAVRGSTTP